MFKFDKLEVASLYGYVPKKHAKYPLQLKRFKFAENLKTDKKEISDDLRPSEKIAEELAQGIKDGSLPFGRFFNDPTKPILIPIPCRHYYDNDQNRCGPLELAKALVQKGLGKKFEEHVLYRPKSSINDEKSASIDNNQIKSNVKRQFEFFEAGKLSPYPYILLIDDIVTTGATFLGAANKLFEAFPNTTIRAFSAFQTVYRKNQSDGNLGYWEGKITLDDDCIHAIRN